MHVTSAQAPGNALQVEDEASKGVVAALVEATELLTQLYACVSALAAEENRTVRLSIRGH